MTVDKIIWGETYDIEVALQDAEGDAIVMDGDWSAACRITKDRVGGEVFLNPAMNIADGVATCSLDTGDSGWAPGVYVYDVRVTDADGNDFWSEPVRLTLVNRNTPNT